MIAKYHSKRKSLVVSSKGLAQKELIGSKPNVCDYVRVQVLLNVEVEESALLTAVAR
jgi:hypothetical protein